MYLLMDTTQSHLFLSLLDTNTDVLSPSVLSNQNTSQVSHYFFSQLQSLCAKAAISAKDITGIAINTGPGSFTGIRVGLTVARTLAKFMKTPPRLFAFNTFELLAATTSFRNQRVCIALNAYRGRHYRAVLCVEDNATITWHESPTIIANTDIKLPEDCPVLIEPTLLPLFNLPESTEYDSVISELDEAMAFLLRQDLQQATHEIKLDTLLPNYMQQPHITVKKAKTS